MTEQELRDKIVEILRYNRDDFIEENYRRDIERIDFYALADALIAEGIGAFHNFLPVRKFLYTSKKCLSIYFESKEDAKLLEEYLENAPTLDLVNYFKHRAEVAELKIKIRDIALLEMAEIIDWDRGTDDETPEEYVKYLLQQAEKELQEERKDD